jgi:ribosomal protein L11 methyltransferase
MSFGTGHHDTTYLMLKNQLMVDHAGKFVYDFGSGTGILAIMAGQLGASRIVGNDVDDWCIENANDNLVLNEIDAEMLLGPVGSLGLTEQGDIILANINKNILLQEMQDYDRLLIAGGSLLLSGFYEEDISDLTQKAEQFGLVYQRHEVKNSWAMLVFNKPA